MNLNVSVFAINNIVIKTILKTKNEVNFFVI